MKIQKTIEVWLVNKRLPKPIDLVQYDTGIQLIFRVKDFTIPTGSTATIYVQKPSGKFVYQTSGITISGDVITMNLENQALAEYGDHIPYQVQIKSGSDTISTFAGMFRVEKSLADAGATESKTVISAFEELTAEQIAEIQAATDALIAQAKQDIELKGADTLASIPEDYTELSALADKAIREKAPGVVCEATGERITVTDASDDYVRGLKLLGKTEQIKTNGYQLFNACGQQNNAFGIATVSDKGKNISVTGAYYVSFPIEMTAGETYYVNFKFSTNGGNYGIRFEYVDNSISETITNPFAFVPEKDVVSIYLYCGTGAEKTVVYEDVQVTKGGTVLPWEPYTGGAPSPSPDYPQELVSVGNSGSITETVCGKNMLYIPDGTKTSNGVTATAKDGVITLNGTATATAFVQWGNCVSVVKGNQYYYMSDKVSGVTSFLGVSPEAWGEEPTFGTAMNYSKVMTANASLTFMLMIDKGAVLNNAVISPQITFGTSATAFETGGEPQTLTVATPNGLPGIPVSSGGNYTDENGQQWVCDEIDLARGVYIRRITKVVLNGTENYIDSGIGTEKLKLSNYLEYDYTKEQRLMCSHFEVPPVFIVGTDRGHGTVCMYPGGSGYWEVAFKHTSKTMATYATEQYNAGNPITLLYQGAYAYETDLSAEEKAAFAALHTNKPNTTVYNDAGAHQKIAYIADTKAYIDNKFAELATAIVNNA